MSMSLRHMLLVALVLGATGFAQGAAPALPSRNTQKTPKGVVLGTGRSMNTSNLCFNATFDSTNSPLEGWITDYQWSGNAHYQANHTRVTVLPSFKGEKNVMYLDGASGGYTDTKAECQPIPFEKGARYQCSLDYQSTTGPHIYFVGYKWKPGIRPYYDKPPHPGDLRRIYKSAFRDQRVSNGPNGWKKTTFEFPMENPSELAQENLKEIRFFTFIIIVLADHQGLAYMDDVYIKRIK